MAENSGGYIGNKPSDSSVTIARQAYTSTGVTTDFTFRSGYTPGYLDAYLNGVRLIETDDYVATDGTTLSLTTAAQDGDTLELIAYKAFNVSEFTLETELGGNFNVSNDLTVGGNINLEGNLDLQDNDKILLGTGDDLQIFHNTSHGLIENNTGSLYLFNYADDQDIILSTDNGSGGTNTYILCDGSENSTKLYAAGSIKLKTISTGVDVTGVVQTDTLDVSGASTFSGNLNIGTGATVGFGSTAYFKDNASAFFGDGEDLKIYHDGTNSYVSDVGTGGLKITGGDVYIRNVSDQDMIHASSGSFVKLYHNSSEKLATTSSGAIVTGILTATDFSGASGGAADFPNGLTGTTASFTGNVSIAGTLTYEDVTNIDSVGLITARNGLHVTGGSVGIGTTAPTTESGFTKVLHVYDDSPQVLLERETGSGNVRAGFNAWSGNASLETFTDTPLRIRTSGNTNQLYLNTDGKVGINSTSPLFLLEVNHADEDGILLKTANTAASFINFSDGDDNDVGQISYDHATNHLGIRVNADERFRITSAGDVGIGVTNPTSFGPTLQVAGTDPALLLQDTATAVDYFGINVQSGAVINWFDDSAYFAIGAAAGISGASYSEKLRITSDGDVGIGTDSPDFKLHSNETGGSSISGLFETNQTDSFISFQASGTTASSTVRIGATGDDFRAFINGGERLRITSAGSVKIGSSNVVEINPSNEYPTIRPTLDLNFAATKTLDRRITFTRDSLGTYVGEDGLVKYASNNVPRFDHDPTTGESLGLLIEESRVNYLNYSEMLANWNFGATGDTFTESTGSQLSSNPDGSSPAYHYAPSSNSGHHRFYKTVTVPTLNTEYVVSLFVKRVTAGSVSNLNRYVELEVTGNFNGNTPGTGQSGTIGGAAVTFDMQDLVIQSVTDNTNGYVGDAKIETYSNGWYRLSYVFNPGSGSQFTGTVWWGHPATFGGDAGNETGNGNPSFYFWGASVEKGSFLTSYIPTSGSTVTRDDDDAAVKGTNFSDIYNETEGTIFSEFSTKVNTGTTSKWIVSLRDPANNNNYIAQSTYGSNTVALSVLSGGSSVAYISNANSVVVDQFRRVAASFKVNDFDGADGGTLLTGDTSGAMPTGIARMDIGRGWTDGGQKLEGHIKSIKYYRTKLSDSQLQGLTQQ